SPTRGEGADRMRGESVGQQESCLPDEIEHDCLVWPRRDPNRTRPSGDERLRYLARETKLHRRKRMLAHALALRAIDIGLRAAARKMQHAAEGVLREGIGNRAWESLDLDRAITHHRHDRHVANGQIAGTLLAGEVKERPQLFAAMRTQQIDEIVLVAVGG